MLNDTNILYAFNLTLLINVLAAYFWSSDQFHQILIRKKTV